MGQFAITIKSYDNDNRSLLIELRDTTTNQITSIRIWEKHKRELYDELMSFICAEEKYDFTKEINPNLLTVNGIIIKTTLHF